MLTLAHLSDPHVAPLPKPSLGSLMNKRFLGWLSWRRRRAGIHRRQVLEALTRDLLAQSPDHVVVTGDLTNISLPDEFKQAATWLRTLGAAERVTVVPGNHDAYIDLPWERSWAHWAGHMDLDLVASERIRKLHDTGFPFVRRDRQVALIGLSTALATLPGSAAGRLGRTQLDKLEACLTSLGQEGTFRCILLHHPPVGEALGWRKSLRDAEAFRAVIARAGCELVLHGHDHEFRENALAGPMGPIPVYGVPSASAMPGRRRPGAHYNLYTICRKGDGWQLAGRSRGLTAGPEDIAEGRLWQVDIPG